MAEPTESSLRTFLALLESRLRGLAAGAEDPTPETLTELAQALAAALRATSGSAWHAHAGMELQAQPATPKDSPPDLAPPDETF